MAILAMRITTGCNKCGGRSDWAYKRELWCDDCFKKEVGVTNYNIASGQ